MKLKLKEDPREWRKFVWTSSLALAAISAFLSWRRVLPLPGLLGIVMFLGLLSLLALVRPAWFRSPYRAGMTISFYLGQVMGRVLLTLFFLLVVTPLGVVLRLLGKDLLSLKRQAGVKSYWRPVKATSPLDRAF